MSLTLPIITFVVGLLVGQLLTRPCDMAGVQKFLDGVGRAVSAPFLWVTRSWQKKVVTQDTVQSAPEPNGTPIDPREQQISDSAQAVRSILVMLTAAIERTELAASESSDTLKSLRDSLDQTGLPPDMAKATSHLLEQINRMISHNASLKGRLADSQEILTVQHGQINALRTAVLIDGMTGLANRSSFDDKLAEMVRLRHRYEDTFFLMIIDVDYFKAINDTHGHPAGDRILKGVAFKLRAALRATDFLARFGGDEFALILVKSTAGAAADLAGKLCTDIRESRFLLDDAEIKVTLSIGVAEIAAGDTTESLLRRADQALYRVKQTGRNGVILADPPMASDGSV